MREVAILLTLLLATTACRSPAGRPAPDGSGTGEAWSASPADGQGAGADEELPRVEGGLQDADAGQDAGQAAGAAASAPSAGNPTSGGGAPAITGVGGASPPVSVATPGPEEPGFLRGSFTTRLRHRNGRGDDDSDVFGVLELDAGDEERHPLTAHVVGRLSKDLDGDRAPGNAFFELSDTYDSSWNGKLYEAWVEVTDTSLETLRLGRQWLTETPELLTLDGVLMATRERAVLGSQLGLYAGRPHHDFESSPEGDSLAGAWLASRPWSGGRTRIDWMHVVDELGDDVTERNDLLGLSVWQQAWQDTELRGRYTWLDGDGREVELAGTWFDVERDLLVDVSWRKLLEEQRRQAQVLDEFTAVLQTYQPFEQTRVMASKGFGGDYELQVGYDVRELEDTGDEGPFNREFDRWWATGTVFDVADVEGLSVALTGEEWDDDGSGGGSNVTTWGLDVTRRWGRALSASLGTYYALFKNDFLLEQEREHVRTYYGRLRYRLENEAIVSLGVEYEDADLGDFRTFTARLTWPF